MVARCLGVMGAIGRLTGHKSASTPLTRLEAWRSACKGGDHSMSIGDIPHPNPPPEVVTKADYLGCVPLDHAIINDVAAPLGRGERYLLYLFREDRGETAVQVRQVIFQ